MSTDVEILESPEIPPLPATVSGAGAGAAKWAELWEIGGAAYADVDRFVIERYCVAVQQWYDAQREIDLNGYTTIGSKGQEVEAPAVKLKKDTEAVLQQLEDKLGLSPAARLKLTGQSLENEGKKSALGEMLDG